MTINSLKELDKLMLMCKKRKIKFIKIDNIEFHIDTDTEPIASTKHYQEEIAPDVFDPGKIQLPLSTNEKIQTPDELTEDQLLMWSAAPGGTPSI